MNSSENSPFDAILVVSFGGPEAIEDVIPFLENVLRGKNVPRERMLEVAHHYEQFGGVSPINQQARDLINAIKPAMSSAGIELPIYWGNRNWEPMLPDTILQMKNEGIKKALAIVLSGYSCYSGCRQYRENIEQAQQQVGEGAPVIEKLRSFYNHPLFIEANAKRIAVAMGKFPTAVQQQCSILFTAHSIPESMSQTSDYVKQLQETARLISSQLNIEPSRYQLVYQSRSGRPQDPWLEPDILDALSELHTQGEKNVIVAPIGFLSDHMEVLFDLDIEAKQFCEEHQMQISRAETVGTHTAFIKMLIDLMQERIENRSVCQAIGKYEAAPNICKSDCCPAPRRP